MIKALAAKAMQGNVNATRTLVDLIGRLLNTEIDPGDAAPLSAEDQHIIDTFLRRRLAKKGA